MHLKDTLIYKAIKLTIEITKPAAFLFYYILFYNHQENGCDNQSKYYEYAHTLSAERLEKIHQDFKKFASEETILNISKHKPKSVMPEFEDLEFTRVTMSDYDIDQDKANIRLNFCIDQSIDIEISGILSEEPIIKLVWGEIERNEEVLWRGSN